MSLFEKDVVEYEEESERKKDKKLIRKLKSVIAVIIIIAIVAAGGLIYYNAYRSAEEKFQDQIADLVQQIEDMKKGANKYVLVTQEVVLNTIDSELKEIGELASMEYNYTNAGKYSDPKQVFGLDIPFTTKSFIAKWDGTIKAGVKIEKITVKVDDSQKIITIFMPAAEILSHDVDENSVETLNEKDGLFNPVRVEDVRTFDAESAKHMEQKAIENGLLEKAAANAERIIEKLILANPAIAENYKVVFEAA